LLLEAESLIKEFRFFITLRRRRCSPAARNPPWPVNMKTELIYSLTEHFEAHAQQTNTGVEFWLARDHQHLLGYAKWENFVKVVNKAEIACETSGHAAADHFPDVRKMVDLGSGSQREVDDIMLTRHACYLVAQNGDPKKHEIAFAQTYFAVQTRRAELIDNVCSTRNVWSPA
jgi:DNA-damage-inducible protein D